MLTPKSANSLWGWHLSTTVPLRLWRGVLIEHCLHLATSYHHRLFRLKFLVLLCNLVETCWKTQLGNMVSVLFFEGRGRGNTWHLFSWKLCCTYFTFASLSPLSLSKVPVTLYRCVESGLRVAAAQARRTPDRLVERSRAGTVPQVKSPTVHGYFTVHTDTWWSLWCTSFLVPLKGRQSERLEESCGRCAVNRKLRLVWGLRCSVQSLLRKPLMILDVHTPWSIWFSWGVSDTLSKAYCGVLCSGWSSEFLETIHPSRGCGWDFWLWNSQDLSSVLVQVSWTSWQIDVWHRVRMLGQQQMLRPHVSMVIDGT